MQITWLPILSLLLAYFSNAPMSYTSSENVNTVDGPYVMYAGDTMLVHYIDSNEAGKALRTSVYHAQNPRPAEIVVGTDEPGKTFTVKLREKHKPEKAEYGRSSKMLVLSDIEGNFRAFRQLLQAAGVIDADFKWTFGDGDLVIIGDMVDRGDMVTEVLWLIYALEEQAEAAKGKVHYILGNHELMNMTGDVRYVHPRYLQNAQLVGTDYMQMVGLNSEFGRWFSSKNIVERIGNMLFVHGGISPDMTRMAMPLNEINNITRPWYADSTYSFTDPRLHIILGDGGPMWYRGYYYGANQDNIKQIDSTLQLYQVKHIVTGHTIIDTVIVSAHGGRLIDTDVHHSRGHSEALLVEKRDMVRINSRGERLPLQAHPKL